MLSGSAKIPVAQRYEGNEALALFGDIRFSHGAPLSFHETLAEHNVSEGIAIHVGMRWSTGVGDRGYVVKDWDTVAGQPKAVTLTPYFCDQTCDKNCDINK